MEQNPNGGRVQVHAHLEPQVAADLAAAARANERSLAAEIRVAVGEHLRQRDAQSELLERADEAIAKAGKYKPIPNGGDQ